MVKRKQGKAKVNEQSMVQRLAKNIIRKDIEDKDNGHRVWKYL